MALTSALYTGLSGLDVNQTALNVVGNNIANANSVAFKSSRVVDTPQFYVTTSGGTAPTSNFGGTNPNQTGLGAQVGSIEKDFTSGSLETTGKSTDLAINGSGFFVTGGTNGQLYTRDGNFSLNSTNQLITSTGQFVQGFGINSTFNIVPGKLQNLTIPLGATSTAQATSVVNLAGNFNSGGPLGTGSSIINSQAITTVGGAVPPTGADLLTNLASSTNNATPLFTAGDVYTLNGQKGSQDLPPRTFTVTAASTLSDLQTFFQNGLQIDASVPPPSPTGPTPGTTLVADPTDPNSVILAFTGNTGTANALTLGTGAFKGSTGASPFSFADGVDANGNTSDPKGESISTTAVAYDSLGNPINVGVTAVLQQSTATGTVWQFTAASGSSTNPTGSEIVGSGSIAFDTTGKLLTAAGTTLSIARNGTGAGTPLTLKLNFGGVTSLASTSSTFVVSSQDGTPIGSLSSFSIGNNGVITGSFSNGLTRPLGQVALATFNNPQGLNDEGNNLYGSGADSGAAIITTPTDLGSGSIQAGALELSNVDLSKEFTNLIIASTGFSAASRVITTSNQLITELLNSSR